MHNAHLDLKKSTAKISAIIFNLIIMLYEHTFNISALPRLQLKLSQ